MSKLIPISIVDYLMNGDVSIRWQTLKYLAKGDAEEIHRNRLLMEFEGWGKALLDLQGENGLWYESLMIDRYRSTLWVLQAFRRLGIYPLDQFIAPCRALVETLIDFRGGIRWEGTNEVHTCLTGLVLGVCCYFRYLDEKLEAMFHYLIETQSADGSWVCPYHSDPRTHRFKTTLAVLEGLREYQQIYHYHDSYIKDLQRNAHEFLLNHFIDKASNSSTEPMKGVFEFPFPYFSYDILSVLDYLRSVNFGTDHRLYEVQTQLDLRMTGGKYQIDAIEPSFRHPVVLEEPGLSRYNTLRAYRVLKHWNRT